ncbi:hypothetical protein HYU21_01255 [Candidatus Woesearchaeota archaeon]|nr:hypothetical protein [Candidatus Woesearchaeota archaeon]
MPASGAFNNSNFKLKPPLLEEEVVPGIISIVHLPSGCAAFPAVPKTLWKLKPSMEKMREFILSSVKSLVEGAPEIELQNNILLLLSMEQSAALDA